MDEHLQEQRPNFLSTLKQALVEGIEITLNLDEGEISGFVSNLQSDDKNMTITIYETAEGGVGSLQTLFNKSRFEQIISKTLELLHDKDQDRGCLKACYECLLNFYNQREHETFDRRLVIPFLKNFRNVQIKEQDQGNNESNLRFLLEKCGSNFEKQVLNEISRRGLPLPDDSQKIFYHKDIPVARADFYYSKKNIVLFVDGEPHGKDHVMKADDRKRTVLKSLGYRVYSVHYSRFEDDIRKLAIALE